MTGVTAPNPDVERCAIVLSNDLVPGLASNGAALLALTAGRRYPNLIGEDFVDVNGSSVPGMCPTGIPVLTTSPAELPTLHTRARCVVDTLLLPTYAQRTKSYDILKTKMSEAPIEEWQLNGLMLVGPAKDIRALTNGLELLGAS